jgi:hypothetical protein
MRKWEFSRINKIGFAAFRDTALYQSLSEKFLSIAKFQMIHQVVILHIDCRRRMTHLVALNPSKSLLLTPTMRSLMQSLRRIMAPMDWRSLRANLWIMGSLFDYILLFPVFETKSF